MHTSVEPPIEWPLPSACAELESALREGREISSEQLLRQHPTLAADKEAALELIYTEFVIRRELGQQPAADSWFKQFPHWEDDLRELFGIHELLDDEADRDGFMDRSTGGGISGPPAELRGRWLGQYEILKELGHGGMGVVYQARQRGLGRIVALKVIRSWSSASAAELIRFRTEAEATARLQHPNIIQVYEVSEHDGCPFLAMEFVDGSNLEETFGDTVVPARLAATLVETLARAAHFAHQHGVVHRDLKPSNILLLKKSDGSFSEADHSPARLTKEFVPKITDFGLAKLVQVESDPNVRDSDRIGVTHRGDTLGTPSFMAPEQASGESSAIGPASDVYALGAILYKLITGRLPFWGETALETLEQVRSQDPVPPRRLRAEVPQDLETICLKCLEKEPLQRYASAAVFADDLRRYLDGEPILARPVATWERAAKWARRRPALASMLGVLAAVSVMAFAAVTWAWQHAETNRIAAEKSHVDTVAAFGQADAALAKEQAERERVENSLYLHNIALVYHKYLDNDLSGANQLLDACRPRRRHWEWHYLKQLCNQQLLTLSQHSLPIQCLTFSRDGQRIAAGSGQRRAIRDGEVSVWDANTGRELFVLRKQVNAVESLEFSPDGQTLATAIVGVSTKLPADVRLWDLQTGRERLVLSNDLEARSLTFHPAGRLLALGCRNGNIRLCDSATGHEERVLVGHGRDRIIHAVTFSPDGSHLASASDDGSICVWDPAEGRQLLTLHAPPTKYNSLALRFSPDGSQLAAATIQGTVKLFDALTGSEIATHELNKSTPHITYRPDEHWPVLATPQHGTIVLHALTDKSTRALPGQQIDSLRAEFSPDGHRLATCSDDKRIRIWDMTRPPDPRTIRVTGGTVVDLTFSPDGEQLAVVTGTRNDSSIRDPLPDRTPRVWIVPAKQTPAKSNAHTGWLSCVAYSPDGHIIATGSTDQSVRLWNAQSNECLFTLTGHTKSVIGIAFQPNGRGLVSVSRDRTLKNWNTDTGQELATIAPAHESDITSIAYALDGRHVAVAGENGVTKVWDVETQREMAVLSGHSSQVNVANFSRMGRLLATGSADGSIHLWDFSATGQWSAMAPRHVLRGHAEPVTGLAFSPDGQRLVSVSEQSLILWDTASGHAVLSPRFQPEGNARVLFSPNGQQLAVSGRFTVTILDAAPLSASDATNQ